MVSWKAASGLIAAAIVAAFNTTLMAAPTYTQLGDSGTLQVTTYAPTLQVTSATLPGPYGSPTISALPGGNGWAINFIPNSNFFAAANNLGGGEKDILSAKLDFRLSFLPADLGNKTLTVNLYENGLYNEVGAGDASVFGGLIVRADNEQVGSGLLGNNAVFSPNGTWSSSIQQLTFTQQHLNYTFSIDNDLTAFAPGANSLASAVIAKKNFQIIVTTDGSNGGATPNVPEPASLSILAVGTLALISRRRRA
jgi:hypothetical protein